MFLLKEPCERNINTVCRRLKRIERIVTRNIVQNVYSCLCDGLYGLYGLYDVSFKIVCKLYN